MKLSEMRELLAQARHPTHEIARPEFFARRQPASPHRGRGGIIEPADKVLEIGPGLGPLTELLLEKAGEVLAIEMDARLVDFLCERFGFEDG